MLKVKSLSRFFQKFILQFPAGDVVGCLQGPHRRACHLRNLLIAHILEVSHRKDHALLEREFLQCLHQRPLGPSLQDPEPPTPRLRLRHRANTTLCHTSRFRTRHQLHPRRHSPRRPLRLLLTPVGPPRDRPTHAHPRTTPHHRRRMARPVRRHTPGNQTTPDHTRPAADTRRTHSPRHLLPPPKAFAAPRPNVFIEKPFN